MKVFLSWSGEAAKKLATGLNEVLPMIIQDVEPLFSAAMKGGQEWLTWLDSSLAEAAAGIFILSPESKNSPWLLYEAGAITQAAAVTANAALSDPSLGKRPLIPVRVGIEEDQVQLPLSRFQSVPANLTGLQLLVDRLIDLDPDRSYQQSSSIRRAVTHYWDHVKGTFAEAERLAKNEQTSKGVPLQCIHPSTCLVRAQGDLSEAWRCILAEEVAKFLALPDGTGRKRVSTAVFASTAVRYRQQEEESIHVLYATEDSIKNYYDLVNDEWINSESPPHAGHRRRRLLVLGSEQQDDRSYRERVVRIHEKLKNTCELRVVDDTDLIRRHPRLLRDMGIFRLSDGQLKGFVAFSEFMTAKVFAQASGSCFLVSDQPYLQDLFGQYEAAWGECENDLELEGTDRVRRWVNEIGPVKKRWAYASSVLSRDAVKALFANEIPAIRIHHVATSAECDRFVEAAQEFTPDNYDLGPDKPIPKIGEPLYEYRTCNDKDRYFDAARRARKTYEAICEKAGWDPVERLREQLKRRSGIEADVATYRNRKYFAGLIRFIEQGTRPHIDFAKADAIGYSVDRVEGQVAWNLFLTAPSSGGYCRVYKSLWSPEYEQCRVSYGYQTSVTEGSPYFDIDAVKGDLVLFNCRNFHHVEETNEDDRITVGSFLGELPGSRYILWS